MIAKLKPCCVSKSTHKNYNRSATLYKARDVFDPRTETGRQDSGLSQIYKLIVSNSAKILTNMNMALSRQVEEENNSLPVTVCE